MRWLLIRGLGRNSSHWGDFPESLQKSNDSIKEVKCLDLPGVDDNIGFKSIRDISDTLREKLIEHKGEKQNEPWSILAISLGGMVALDWCSRYPNDFKNLVTINSSSKESASLFQRISPLAIKTILRIGLTKDLYFREREILKLTTNTLEINEEICTRWEKISKQRPLKYDTFIKQLYCAARFNAPNEIPIPYTAITAREDRFTSYICSKNLAKRYNGDLIIHPSAGHDLPLDDPKWLISQILNI